MRIGVFGRGHVGAALGHAFASAGHEVRYGVRDPAEAEDEEPGLVTLPEAGRWGEVLLLGVPYGAVQEVLHAAGDLDRKIIVDPTNAPKPPTDERSSSQIIAGFVPTAKVVRAFNTVPAEVMLNPRFGEARASTFVCADDALARTTVLGLARDIGFDAVDAGPLKSACSIDRLLAVWRVLAFEGGLGRNLAFQLLRR
ncbi:MAG: NADPH-dependent F420 reductase [Myxococcaceae bacterium]